MKLRVTLSLSGQTRTDLLLVLAGVVRSLSDDAIRDADEPVSGNILNADGSVAAEWAIIEDEPAPESIDYCIHCYWPVAPEGVTLTDRDAEPLDGAKQHRCNDTACVVAHAPITKPSKYVDPSEEPRDCLGLAVHGRTLDNEESKR